MGRYASERNLLQITDYKAALNSQDELCSNIETDYKVTHPILKNAADSLRGFFTAKN